MSTISEQVLSGYISASVSGRPVEIDTDYSSSTDTTTLHTITAASAASMDSVFLKVWNNDTARHVLTLVLNPAGNGSTAVVDAASLKFSLAPQAWTWLLEGERFRSIGGNPYTIAAYSTTAAAVTNKYLRVLGWFNRLTQAVVTP